MNETVLKREILNSKKIECFLDGTQSQWNFNENIKEVEGEDYTYLYIDEGNLSDTVDYGILPRQKGKVINALIENNLTDYTRHELKDLETETVYDHLTSYYGVYSLDKIDSEYIDLCAKYGIKTERGNYLEIEAIGSSQGERATVLVNKSEVLKVWGSKEINERELKETFENYFYKAPANVRVTIFGTEFISKFDGYYQEYQSKNNYDKDEFIAELVDFFKDEIEDIDYFQEQLEDLLPYELPYEA